MKAKRTSIAESTLQRLESYTLGALQNRWTERVIVRVGKRLWIPSMGMPAESGVALLVDGVTADWLIAHRGAIPLDESPRTNVGDVSSDRWIPYNNARPGERYWTPHKGVGDPKLEALWVGSNGENDGPPPTPELQRKLDAARTRAGAMRGLPGEGRAMEALAAAQRIVDMWMGPGGQIKREYSLEVRGHLQYVATLVENGLRMASEAKQKADRAKGQQSAADKRRGTRPSAPYDAAIRDAAHELLRQGVEPHNVAAKLAKRAWQRSSAGGPVTKFLSARRIREILK